jgi:hypothetical protein
MSADADTESIGLVAGDFRLSAGDHGADIDGAGEVFGGAE